MTRWDLLFEPTTLLTDGEQTGGPIRGDHADTGGLAVIGDQERDNGGFEVGSKSKKPFERGADGGGWGAAGRACPLDHPGPGGPGSVTSRGLLALPAGFPFPEPVIAMTLSGQMLIPGGGSRLGSPVPPSGSSAMG